MNKVTNIENAIKVSTELRKGGKKVVLVGGCFDILHVGHIEFLKRAKLQGDILMVLLESDEAIKKIKGENRPFNTQKARARVLEALECVDFVLMLPPINSDKKYDTLVFNLKPAIIATTKGDQGKIHKIRQANLVQGEVIEVINRIPERSTTRLAPFV